MEVVLVSFTLYPEKICAEAMRSCRTKQPMHKVILEKPPSHYIRLAKKLGHFSVLEHASFTFSVEGISRACSHQLVRHRIASYSQQSQRCVDPIGSDWYVVPESIRKINLFKYQLAMSKLSEVYKDFVECGVPKEDARFVLPNACKTNIVITMNGRELLHFFKLRLDLSAQWEIREMAKKMLEEARVVAPSIFESCEEYGETR